MARWWWGPYWAAEHRSRRDDADRVYQIDYRLTELHITNPTDRDGVVDLVFHEARGDGNFYRSDWASGSWSAPPRWQRYYRPDPSREFGDHFFTYGWFEAWTSLDEILIDVRLLTIARNAAGGLVENIAERTIDLVPRRAPLAWVLPELIDRFRSADRSHLYAPGLRPTEELPFLEPYRPGESGDDDEP